MPQICFRVPPELSQKIEAEIEESIHHEDVSQFCRTAIRSYLQEQQSGEFDPPS